MKSKKANSPIKNTVMMNEKILNHKAHKEHKGFFVLLNPKSKTLNPNLLFCFLIFDISFLVKTINEIKEDNFLKKDKE